MSYKVQSSKFKVQSSKFDFAFPKARRLSLFTFYLLLFTFPACSIPNLEKPECTAARQAVKEFYSFHFGGEMKPSKENARKRQKFLSDELNRALAAALETESATDYFTRTDDYPKAFRIGECAAGENRTVFQVVLFWKDDARSEQREVQVEAVRQNGKWLINGVGD